MHPEAMIATFKSLKLFGMAQAIDDLSQQGSPAWHGAESVLDALLKANGQENSTLARSVVRTMSGCYHFYDGAKAERELGHSPEPIEDTLDGTIRWLVHVNLLSTLMVPNLEPRPEWAQSVEASH